MYCFVIISSVTNTALAVAKSTPSASGFDFTSLLPLVGVLIGGLVSAATSYFLSNRTNIQQRERDERASAQQQDRDRVAYEQQLQRERIAYERSLRDARRERLRSAYKVILNAAREYSYAVHDLQVIYEGETEETRNQRLNASLKERLKGVDEAMIEITLEDVGVDVISLFHGLRQAFNSYARSMDTTSQARGTFSQEQLDNYENTVINKVEELTTSMQKQLKELES